jgi:hypothetical protein
MAAKIQVRGPADCWEWTGGRNKRGYGTVNVDGRSELAPRVMFRLMNGYWPTCTRHTCDNPACCNPVHLLDGSKKDNADDRDARGRNGYSKRTHCPAGHEYTEENTVVKHHRSGKRKGRSYRACKTCLTLRRAARSARAG